MTPASQPPRSTLTRRAGATRCRISARRRPRSKPKPACGRRLAVGKCRAGIIIPSWTHDLRSMLKACGEPGHKVIVRCLKCYINRALERDDFDRIVKARGEAFSLFNKRTRC